MDKPTINLYVGTDFYRCWERMLRTDRPDGLVIAAYYDAVYEVTFVLCGSVDTQNIIIEKVPDTLSNSSPGRWKEVIQFNGDMHQLETHLKNTFLVTQM